MNIIDIEDLTYTYPGAETPILDHVNLQVEKGISWLLLATTAVGNPPFARP